MPYFARGEQSRQLPPRGAQSAFRALISLALLVTLLPLRQAEAQAQVTNPANQVIFKNFDGTETPPQPVLTDCDGENCDADSTEHKKPSSPTTQNALAAGTRSDMVEVQTPEMWPYAPTVKLFSYWPSGETTTCSGMLVDAKVVLTAGSCIYSHDPALCTGGDSSCWVTDVSAVPAYTDGEAPHGRSGYESIMTWTAWTEGQNQAFDLAAIRLRYPIGVTTGWLGVGFNTNNATFTGNLLANTSYPQDAPYTGDRMYGWDGVVTDPDSSEDIFYLNGSCDAGRIGSSLYNAHDGITYGVFSHNDAVSGIGITRITYAKFDSLRTFIQVGQPKIDGGDLVPFYVRAEPTTLFPDQKLSDFSFYLQNYSESPIPLDTYQVNVYLSQDPLIGDACDTSLSSFNFTGAFEPNQGLRVTLPDGEEIRIPEEIHGSEPLGGTFYLGVTITGSQGNPENSENNRSEYQQPKPIWIFDSDNHVYFFTIWKR